MKRLLLWALVLALGMGLTCACGAAAKETTGEAQGYGGVLAVTVRVEDGQITRVRVTRHQETEGIGTRAIEALPAAIVAANSVDVDDVSGATYTSQAIKAAVSQALGRVSGAPAEARGQRASLRPEAGGTGGA